MKAAPYDSGADDPTGVGLPEQIDRRKGLDRRRYNRRDTDGSPPYYQVFERIASSLEQIERHLQEQQQREKRRR